MHTRRYHSPIPTFFLASAGFLASGCEPGTATRRYELSEATREALVDQPEVQEQIHGALEMLFGTPENPRFMLLTDWWDEGFDPNWPIDPADDGGSGELSEDRIDRIQTDNRRRFASELELIDAGRFDELGPFSTAPVLQDDVRYRVEHPDEFDDVAQELRGLLIEHYPSLRDSSELYRQQCVHCHGNSGGGDGPTASFLNPRPRDYRHGVFKFTAVKDKAMPRREDLFKILADGVTGTAMPSFRRFSEAELEGLVDYVRLLSMRGMTERLLVANYESDEVLTPDSITETYVDVFERWQGADEKYVAFEGEIPAPTPELLARGKQLFNDDKTGNCASCHGTGGLGDGASAWKAAEDGSQERIEDDWGYPIVPRNLTVGIFRGGKRPIDIYRRIYSGINGTPMPALGDSKDPAGNPLLSPDDLWALVHYVRSLSERPGGIGIVPHPIVGGHADHADAGHGGSQPDQAAESTH